VEFFTGRNEEIQAGDFFLDCDEKIRNASFGKLLEASNPELLRKIDPEFAASMDALAQERSMDDGSMKGFEFRKVASFKNVPLFEALRIQEGLLKGKKEFYKLLEKYPQHRSYDRRGKDHPTETFVNGVPA
jgi:hypothetical protein